LWKPLFNFGLFGDIHVESEKFEAHARKFTGYSNQPGNVCADLFAFCEFPEK
jgi:hypothetical protein